MAKYTIEELYRGDKYSILSAIGAKAIRSGIDPHTADGQTWLEMELIRSLPVYRRAAVCRHDGVELRRPFRRGG